MNVECKLCKSSVRQDLMSIHIKHYHNIPQDQSVSSLLIRIEVLEKQVESLQKENAKQSAINSLATILSPGLSHMELKKLCQDLHQLDSFYFKTAMAMIRGYDVSNSITNGMKNNLEEDKIEKVIVGLEPSNAVSLSNYIDNANPDYHLKLKNQRKVKRLLMIKETRKVKRSRK